MFLFPQATHWKSWVDGGPLAFAFVFSFFWDFAFSTGLKGITWPGLETQYKTVGRRSGSHLQHTLGLFFKKRAGRIWLFWTHKTMKTARIKVGQHARCFFSEMGFPLQNIMLRIQNRSESLWKHRRCALSTDFSRFHLFFSLRPPESRVSQQTSGLGKRMAQKMVEPPRPNFWNFSRWNIRLRAGNHSIICHCNMKFSFTEAQRTDLQSFFEHVFWSKHKNPSWQCCNFLVRIFAAPYGGLRFKQLTGLSAAYSTFCIFRCLQVHLKVLKV